METRKPALAPERQSAADTFERDFGEFGKRERRTFGMEVEEVRESGAGEGQFTIRGHAAVFGQWSLDLGGFREKVAKTAFDRVLGEDPDVRLNWDHDTRWMLARTRNNTLELRPDPRGLHYWGRVAPTSYAEDLRILMERGDIDQASFAFTVARDEWKITGEGDDERVERTILEVGELFDVTVTAMGAYPQTDSQVVRAHALAYAHNRAAPDSPAGTEADESRNGSGLDAEAAAQEDPAGSQLSPLDEFKRAAAKDAERVRAAQNAIQKELAS